MILHYDMYVLLIICIKISFVLSLFRLMPGRDVCVCMGFKDRFAVQPGVNISQVPYDMV